MWKPISILILFFIITILSLCRGSCVSNDIAFKTAEVQGFTEIEVIEHVWFGVGLRGCSSSDAARFTVQAKNSNGKPVTIYVCSGWILKSATIRVP